MYIPNLSALLTSALVFSGVPVKGESMPSSSTFVQVGEWEEGSEEEMGRGRAKADEVRWST